MMRRKVLVVEDDALLAALLADSLTAYGFDVRCCKDAADGREASEAFDPDIALLDIALGSGPSGLDLAHVLHERRPDIALLFLSRQPDVRLSGATAGIPPGAGFLRKDRIGKGQELIDAIEAVLRDQPGQARHDLGSAPGSLHTLTRTQLEVLRLAAQGLSNDAIARARDTTERATEIQLRNVYRALGLDANPDVNPRVEAVRRYLAATGVEIPT